jgi:selenide,water dikinase
MVETVDVITPIVDDPYTFGAVCAANSVSDIFAMGGTPLTALAILGYPSCDYKPAVIRRLLKGAIVKLQEADACLIGGHSIEDEQFKFGFAISGIVEKNNILKTSGANAGDVLVLTKPLGTGVLCSAVKRKKMKESSLKQVIASMLTLNKTAARAAVQSGAKGATDVTGFGLLGHALNIAESSGVDLVIQNESVPLMKRAKEFISDGFAPKGAKNNLGFVLKKTTFSRGISNVDKLALADPQTSGGLLVAIPQKNVDKFKNALQKTNTPYWIIGEAVKGRGRIIVK